MGERRRLLERAGRLGPAPLRPPVFTWCLGRPTMDGKTALGASSPAKPALTSPEPLSHTSAVVSSSSHIFGGSHGPEKQRGGASRPPRTARRCHRAPPSPPGGPSAPSRPPSRRARAAAAHRQLSAGAGNLTRPGRMLGGSATLVGRALNRIRRPLSSPRFKRRPGLQDAH